MRTPAVQDAAVGQALALRFAAARAASRELVRPLGAEDAAAQSMPDASPAKWHLAHTAWFFETFVLQHAAPGYRVFHPQFAALFNSYYHGVGQPYARSRRGLLSRPSLAQVMDYRSHVDDAVLRLLARGDAAQATLELIELGLHHEYQHQELLLTDLQHLFAQNPLQPVYRAAPSPPAAAPATGAPWREYAGGIVGVGHDGAGFAFDNERPRHRVLLRPYALARRMVGNAEFRGFIDDGGYCEPRLWLSDGWAAVEAQRWQRPLYWMPDLRSAFTLHGVQPLADHDPVCHLSYYEAEAYARWAGARLPTEAEWEHAAAREPLRGQFAESGLLLPQAGDSLHGAAWCWTASPYLAYPGFRPAAGAVGEYNGKFMCNQWVLRGGSCATPAAQLRSSYRSFFYADARWQFSGLRLAKELD